MKKANPKADDELRPEYKRSDFGPLVRGKYAAQGANVYITHDLASEDEGKFLAQVRLVMPIRDVSGLGFRSDELTSAAHIIADVLTWTTVLKAAAGIFLAQLTKNAADEVWKKKEDLLKALGTTVARPLRTLARAFSAANQRDIHTDARVAFSCPGAMFDTILSIRATDELEAAWLLANFVMNAERVQEEVEQLLETGAQPTTGFFVDVSTEGEVSLRWFEIEGKRIHRIDS